MRDIAVVSFQKLVGHAEGLDEVEMLAPTIARALADAGLKRRDVGFTVSGSGDYLGGRPFSFVTVLDAVGAWPPIRESHVEMDGAWALYEAWVALQHGDVDVALVYAFGRPTLGAQLDPYCIAPLGADAVSLAALQARAMIDAGRCTERDLATVVARARGERADDLLSAPYVASPLRAHNRGPIFDGAIAVVLVAGDRARTCCGRPAWIRGIDHRIEAPALGSRDLTCARSVEMAAGNVAVQARPVDLAEIDAPYSHQELLVREALGLGASTVINPSGGALAAWPCIVSGLLRIGEAASRIHSGSARRTVAHATSGPCLQQNLVSVMEAE